MAAVAEFPGGQPGTSSPQHVDLSPFFDFIVCKFDSSDTYVASASLLSCSSDVHQTNSLSGAPQFIPLPRPLSSRLVVPPELEGNPTGWATGASDFSPSEALSSPVQFLAVARPPGFSVFCFPSSAGFESQRVLRIHAGRLQETCGQQSSSHGSLASSDAADRPVRDTAADRDGVHNACLVFPFDSAAQRDRRGSSSSALDHTPSGDAGPALVGSPTAQARSEVARSPPPFDFSRVGQWHAQFGSTRWLSFLRTFQADSHFLSPFPDPPQPESASPPEPSPRALPPADIVALSVQASSDSCLLGVLLCRLADCRSQWQQRREEVEGRPSPLQPGWAAPLSSVMCVLQALTGPPPCLAGVATIALQRGVAGAASSHAEPQQEGSAPLHWVAIRLASLQLFALLSSGQLCVWSLLSGQLLRQVDLPAACLGASGVPRASGVGGGRLHGRAAGEAEGELQGSAQAAPLPLVDLVVAPCGSLVAAIAASGLVLVAAVPAEGASGDGTSGFWRAGHSHGNVLSSVRFLPEAPTSVSVAAEAQGGRQQQQYLFSLFTTSSSGEPCLSVVLRDVLPGLPPAWRVASLPLRLHPPALLSLAAGSPFVSAPVATGRSLVSESPLCLPEPPSSLPPSSQPFLWRSHLLAASPTRISAVLLQPPPPLLPSPPWRSKQGGRHAPSPVRLPVGAAAAPPSLSLPPSLLLFGLPRRPAGVAPLEALAAAASALCLSAQRSPVALQGPSGLLQALQQFSLLNAWRLPSLLLPLLERILARQAPVEEVARVLSLLLRCSPATQLESLCVLLPALLRLLPLASCSPPHSQYASRLLLLAVTGCCRCIEAAVAAEAAAGPEGALQPVLSPSTAPAPFPSHAAAAPFSGLLESLRCFERALGRCQAALQASKEERGREQQRLKTEAPPPSALLLPAPSPHFVLSPAVAAALPSPVLPATPSYSLDQAAAPQPLALAAGSSGAPSAAARGQHLVVEEQADAAARVLLLEAAPPASGALALPAAEGAARPVWAGAVPESPQAMLLRWRAEGAGVKGVTQDVVRSGRLPLALLYLQERGEGSRAERVSGALVELRRGGISEPGSSDVVQAGREGGGGLPDVAIVAGAEAGVAPDKSSEARPQEGQAGAEGAQARREGKGVGEAEVEGGRGPALGGILRGIQEEGKKMALNLIWQHRLPEAARVLSCLGLPALPALRALLLCSFSPRLRRSLGPFLLAAGALDSRTQRALELCRLMQALYPSVFFTETYDSKRQAATSASSSRGAPDGPSGDSPPSSSAGGEGGDAQLAPVAGQRPAWCGDVGGGIPGGMWGHLLPPLQESDGQREGGAGGEAQGAEELGEGRGETADPDGYSCIAVKWVLEWDDSTIVQLLAGAPQSRLRRALQQSPSHPALSPLLSPASLWHARLLLAAQRLSLSSMDSLLRSPPPSSSLLPASLSPSVPPQLLPLPSSSSLLPSAPPALLLAPAPGSAPSSLLSPSVPRLSAQLAEEALVRRHVFLRRSWPSAAELLALLARAQLLLPAPGHATAEAEAPQEWAEHPQAALPSVALLPPAESGGGERMPEASAAAFAMALVPQVVAVAARQRAPLLAHVFFLSHNVIAEPDAASRMLFLLRSHPSLEKEDILLALWLATSGLPLPFLAPHDASPHTASGGNGAPAPHRPPADPSIPLRANIGYSLLDGAREGWAPVSLPHGWLPSGARPLQPAPAAGAVQEREAHLALAVLLALLFSGPALWPGSGEGGRRQRPVGTGLHAAQAEDVPFLLLCDALVHRMRRDKGERSEEHRGQREPATSGSTSSRGSGSSPTATYSQAELLQAVLHALHWPEQSALRNALFARPALPAGPPPLLHALPPSQAAALLSALLFTPSASFRTAWAAAAVPHCGHLDCLLVPSLTGDSQHRSGALRRLPTPASLREGLKPPAYRRCLEGVLRPADEDKVPRALSPALSASVQHLLLAGAPLSAFFAAAPALPVPWTSLTVPPAEQQALLAGSLPAEADIAAVMSCVRELEAAAVASALYAAAASPSSSPPPAAPASVVFLGLLGLPSLQLRVTLAAIHACLSGPSPSSARAAVHRLVASLVAAMQGGSPASGLPHLGAARDTPPTALPALAPPPAGLPWPRVQESKAVRFATQEVLACLETALLSSCCWVEAEGEEEEGGGSKAGRAGREAARCQEVVLGWAGGEDLAELSAEERQRRQRAVEEAVGRRSRQLESSRRWQLAVLFAQQFGLPTPLGLMQGLARRDDWIGLLAYAQSQQVPVGTLASVIRTHVASPSLKAHLLLALRCPSSPPPAATSPGQQSGPPPPADLFSTLDAALRLSHTPPASPPAPAAAAPPAPPSAAQALLRQAERRQWPLLAVLGAAAIPQAPPSAEEEELPLSARERGEGVRLSVAVAEGGGPRSGSSSSGSAARSGGFFSGWLSGLRGPVGQGTRVREEEGAEEARQQPSQACPAQQLASCLSVWLRVTCSRLGPSAAAAAPSAAVPPEPSPPPSLPSSSAEGGPPPAKRRRLVSAGSPASPNPPEHHRWEALPSASQAQGGCPEAAGGAQAAGAANAAQAGPSVGLPGAGDGSLVPLATSLARSGCFHPLVRALQLFSPSAPLLHLLLALQALTQMRSELSLLHASAYVASLPQQQQQQEEEEEDEERAAHLRVESDASPTAPHAHCDAGSLCARVADDLAAAVLSGLLGTAAPSPGAAQPPAARPQAALLPRSRALRPDSDALLAALEEHSSSLPPATRRAVQRLLPGEHAAPEEWEQGPAQGGQEAGAREASPGREATHAGAQSGVQAVVARLVEARQWEEAYEAAQEQDAEEAQAEGDAEVGGELRQAAGIMPLCAAAGPAVTCVALAQAGCIAGDLRAVLDCDGSGREAAAAWEECHRVFRLRGVAGVEAARFFLTTALGLWAGWTAERSGSGANSGQGAEASAAEGEGGGPAETRGAEDSGGGRGLAEEEASGGQEDQQAGISASASSDESEAARDGEGPGTSFHGSSRENKGEAEGAAAAAAEAEGGGGGRGVAAAATAPAEAAVQEAGPGDSRHQEDGDEWEDSAAEEDKEEDAARSNRAEQEQLRWRVLHPLLLRAIQWTAEAQAESDAQLPAPSPSLPPFPPLVALAWVAASLADSPGQPTGAPFFSPGQFWPEEQHLNAGSSHGALDGQRKEGGAGHGAGPLPGTDGGAPPCLLRTAFLLQQLRSERLLPPSSDATDMASWGGTETDGVLGGAGEARRGGEGAAEGGRLLLLGLLQRGLGSTLADAVRAVQRLAAWGFVEAAEAVVDAAALLAAWPAQKQTPAEAAAEQEARKEQLHTRVRQMRATVAAVRAGREALEAAGQGRAALARLTAAAAAVRAAGQGSATLEEAARSADAAKFLAALVPLCPPGTAARAALLRMRVLCQAAQVLPAATPSPPAAMPPPLLFSSLLEAGPAAWPVARSLLALRCVDSAAATAAVARAAVKVVAAGYMAVPSDPRQAPLAAGALPKLHPPSRGQQEPLRQPAATASAAGGDSLLPWDEQRLLQLLLVLQPGSDSGGIPSGAEETGQEAQDHDGPIGLHGHGGRAMAALPGALLSALAAEAASASGTAAAAPKPAEDELSGAAGVSVSATAASRLLSGQPAGSQPAVEASSVGASLWGHMPQRLMLLPAPKARPAPPPLPAQLASAPAGPGKGRAGGGDPALLSTQVDVILLAHHLACLLPGAAAQAAAVVTPAAVRCAVALASAALVPASLRLLLGSPCPLPLGFLLHALLRGGQLTALLSGAGRAQAQAQRVAHLARRAAGGEGEGGTGGPVCLMDWGGSGAEGSDLHEEDVVAMAEGGERMGVGAGNSPDMPLEVRAALVSAAWSPGVSGDSRFLVLEHVRMWRELAEAHEHRCLTHLADWRELSPALQWLDASEETAQLLLLDALRACFSAAQLWARLGAGAKAAKAVAQAALIRLQLQLSQTVVGLSPAAASVVLQQQTEFRSALVIASAYELTTPADWSLLLWRRLDGPATRSSHAFLVDWCSSMRMPMELLTDVAERVQRELQSGRVDHSSGLVRLFTFLLGLLPNIEERLTLATLSRCSLNEIERCNALLDKVPPDSGPLLLKRGHGGSYMLMI